jgi:hypothetical protein
MKEEQGSAPPVIAEHASGAVSDPTALHVHIVQAWDTYIAKSGKRAEIAKTLGVPEDKVQEGKPPFDVEVGPSGIIETTILILLAKGFVTGVGAGAGKATFDYLRSLWTEVSEPLQDPRTQIIGEPIVREPETTGTGAPPPRDSAVGKPKQ